MERRVMMSASLIKDINTTYADANPSNFATSTNLLYFTADDGIQTTQLWQTDGTAAGTKPAVSLVAGAPDATMYDLTVANGNVYFYAQGPSDGLVNGYSIYGLYKSDGSFAGTSEIAKLADPVNLINADGTLYFGAWDPNRDSQYLWKSDGTAAGTVPLTAVPDTTDLTYAGGEFYFLDGTTLWKSDGTPAGTGAVASVANQTGTVDVGGMVAVGNRVFIQDSGQIWTSDGTAAGTQPIPNVFGDGAMASYDGALYYTDFGYTDQLWKTDGTSAGTSLIVSQSNQTYNAEPSVMTVANNTLYFNFADASHGKELWKSDGTSQGTRLVADINPGPAQGFGDVPNPYNYGAPVDEMGVLNGVVYFPGTSGVNGAQLWRSDGTAAGTYQVDQINASTNSSYPGGALTIGGTSYFTAADGIHGDELWKTDGTSAGTMMVDDLNAGPGNSNPQYLTNLNGTLYFTASDGTHTNLYKSDGTAAGTTLVFGRAIGDLTPVGNYLYFEGFDSSNNVNLYRTDGTASGTKFIQILMPPSNFPFLGGPIAEPSLAAFDGTLYFTVLDGASPASLWKVNPDTSTTEIASLPGARGDQGNLTVVGNTLYFAANDVNGNSAIWRSDGTSAGTYMVRTTGSSQYVVNNFYAFDDSLYFTVGGDYPGFVANGVYHTDGTNAGTTLLANVSSFGGFTAAGGKLYFIASNNNSNINTSLYTTDGTAAGTHPVDPSVSSIYSMAPANNLLYFTGQDSSGMRELWQTDGTNTSLVDPSETAAGWQANYLMGQVNNTFLFQGSDPQHGWELWGVPLAPSASSTFVKTDATTSGNWTGVYGSDSYFIIGANGFLPSYVTMTTSDDSYYQWASYRQGDSRAPQDSPGSIYHEAAADYAPSSFSLDLNFIDGQSHQVALYLLDYDRQGRVETVQVANADSGQILDTRTVSNFAGGQYLVYDLGGDVKITFTNAGPQNAVLSGIFFSPPPAAPFPNTTASYAGGDGTTQGNWTGVYGSQGYDVIGGSENLPSYASITVTGAQYYLWATSTTETRDLQVAPGSVNRVAACDYSDSTPFTIEVKLTDGQQHQLSLYLLDYDYRNREDSILVTDAVTGAQLVNAGVSAFSSGDYIRFNVSGDIKITISNQYAPNINSVVSGLFLDPAPVASASFVRTDATTQGNYQGVYGTSGQEIFGVGGNGGANYASLGVSSSIPTYVWNGNTTETRVLQDPGTSNRVAACLYSDASSFTFDVDLYDRSTHPVALYFLDYDNRNRSETVRISNAHTGAVLDTESVSNFSQGKYLVWNLSGDVNITITNSGGLNEVLSGIFFG